MWNPFKQTNPQTDFLPHQRVRILGGYPEDVAKVARFKTLYGTIQPFTQEQLDHPTLKHQLPVIIDGFAEVRYLEPVHLSPRIFIDG